jgi:hypothetical protein
MQGMKTKKICIGLDPEMVKMETRIKKMHTKIRSINVLVWNSWEIREMKEMGSQKTVRTHADTWDLGKQLELTPFKQSGIKQETLREDILWAPFWPYQNQF